MNLKWQGVFISSAERLSDPCEIARTTCSRSLAKLDPWKRWGIAIRDDATTLIIFFRFIFLSFVFFPFFVCTLRASGPRASKSTALLLSGEFAWYGNPQSKHTFNNTATFGRDVHGCLWWSSHECTALFANTWCLGAPPGRKLVSTLSKQVYFHVISLCS